MKKRNICITQEDLTRLEELLFSLPAKRERADLTELETEIKRAKIVESAQIPSSIVTMNSQVRLRDLDSKETMIFTLVFPDEANIDSGKISVLSPIGTAILGYATGKTIAWQVPAGKRRIKIEEVLYQPEAAAKPSKTDNK